MIDMPLNAIPPTTTVARLHEKVEAAKGQCWVDVGFYGGIVPGNAGELKALVKEGVRGFKGFLIDSGVSHIYFIFPTIAPNTSDTLDLNTALNTRNCENEHNAKRSMQVEEFPAVSVDDIMPAMKELANEATTLMFHAEMVPPITASISDDMQHSHPPLAPSGPLTVYQTFLDSRPPSLETYAIAEILSLAPLAPQLPLHIVHLSAVEAIPLLREARRNVVRVTAETCFHYLSLAAEGVRAGDTRHKCCPPIRAQANQDGLWAELRQDRAGGVIQTVVSDHSPCTPALKLLPPELETARGKAQEREEGVEAGAEAERGDFFAAWGGISSVGLGLPILWTEGTRRDANFSIEDVVRWCCRNTAKQVGLERTKGDLGVGFDADIVIFDDEESFVVS